MDFRFKQVSSVPSLIDACSSPAVRLWRSYDFCGTMNTLSVRLCLDTVVLLEMLFPPINRVYIVGEVIVLTNYKSSTNVR